MTTRKNDKRNQIVTNINYDENSLSIFWKPLTTKSKGHQMKFILKRLTGFFWNKIWEFSSMRLGNKLTRNGQNWQKFNETLLFLKKLLNSNWLKTLRIKWNHWESFLYVNRERLRPFIIQDKSCDYKKNNKHRKTNCDCY